MKLCLVIGCIAFALLPSIESTLELVHVFFRHGSRSPEAKDAYPLDPYTEKDFMPMGWGQLTNIGKKRAYRLGQLLRERYDSFLGDIYTPEMVQAQTTDFDRTKMSALLVLAGLFPPSKIQQWHDDLSWMPVPYHVERAANDFFLRRPTHYCPAYVEELENIFTSNPEVLKLLEDNRNILNYIAVNSGKSIDSLMDVFRLYQTLNAEEALNMTLPKWTWSVYPERIHELAAQQCHFENANNVLKRLNGGRSLHRVLSNIEAKLSNTSSTRIYLYSGHENNVVNVLSALDVFQPHVPKYSAAVIIELHHAEEKEDNSYNIKVMYVRDVDEAHEPEVKVIDGCGGSGGNEAYCPYERFVAVTRPKVPVNYTEECRSAIFLD